MKQPKLVGLGAMVFTNYISISMGYFTQIGTHPDFNPLSGIGICM